MDTNRLTLSLLVLLLTATYAPARQKSQSLADGASAREVSFSYRFENPRFDIRVIEIDLDSKGAGELRFTRGTSDEILDCKVKLLPATIARIRQLFEVSGFLASATEYQDKKDFSHMGWVTLGVRQGARERKTRFNFTTHVHMKTLGEIFRGIASQEISLFDIENAERYQPLDLPKQIETLANDLRLERIAEPERLLTALNEIAGDDFLPLIARNHAKTIVEAIKKGKFKSPVKK
ncbi:MAG: hypothetical protein AABN33_03420 [Acidobacteriota bacterium]